MPADAVVPRLELSRACENSAIGQLSLFGFGTEDIMYIVRPLVRWDVLAGFLLLALIGLPSILLLMIREFFVRNWTFPRQADERA